MPFFLPSMWLIPLSVMKMTRVLSSAPQASSFSIMRPKFSSMFSIIPKRPAGPLYLSSDQPMSVKRLVYFCGAMFGLCGALVEM